MSRLSLLCFLGLVLFWTSGSGALAMNATQPEKRVALVVGNSAYTYTTPLKNPVNDADKIAKVLESLGFEVVLGLDLTHSETSNTVRKFAKRLNGVETALFFYAGHGLQVNGVNYLIPVDARLGGEEDLEFESMRLERVIELMERVPRNLIFLDACRNNPLARSLARSMGTRSVSIGRGLAKMEVRAEAMISFATEPGQVALDGAGRHSPFTDALLKHIVTPDLDIAFLMRRVRKDVKETTQQKQIPWHNSSLTDPFVFNETKNGTAHATGAAPANILLPPRIDNQAIEIAYWNSISNSNNAAAFQAYLSQFPKGVFAKLAKLKLEEITKRDDQLKPRRTIKDGSNKKVCKAGFLKDNKGNCIPVTARKRQATQRKSTTSRRRDTTKKKKKADWECRAIWGNRADRYCD